MIVRKRNGSQVEFDKNKIVTAILKAFAHKGQSGQEAERCAQTIAQQIEQIDVETISVEEIQNLVERKLMASSHKDVAKAYINHRYLREMARDQYQELMGAVAEKLEAKNVQNQNANVDEHSFGGRVGEASDVVTKHYALKYCVSPMARENHIKNRIYIHDLNSYAVGNHNCLSVPFDDLLARGFNTRQTDVRPAQSINTAFQLVAVIFQLQSLQQFGGVSATHLDWTMVPYVRKSFYKHYIDGMKYVENDTTPIELPNSVEGLPIDDPFYMKYPKAHRYAMDMTVKETYQAVEGMYHNLNTLQSRSGNQLRSWLAVQK